MILTPDEKLLADKNWLKDQLGTFEEEVTKKFGPEGQQGEKKDAFRSLIFGVAFGEDFDGKELNKTETVSFSQFDINANAPEEEGGASRPRENLLTLWMQYLATLKLEEEERKVFIRAKQKQAIEYLQSHETTWMSFNLGKSTSEYKQYHELLNKEQGPSLTPGDKPGVAAPESAPISAWMYRPSYGRSSLAALAGGGIGAAITAEMLFPIAASMLVGSTSKMALCTALGVIGFPLAGIVAGVGSGIAVSVYKNRQSIGADFNAAQGFANKSAALWKGVGQSINGKQLLLNAAFGAIGGFGVGIVTDLLSDSTCVADALNHFADAAGSSNSEHMHALLLERDSMSLQLDGLNHEVTDLQSTIDAQAATITDQAVEMESLADRVNALESMPGVSVDVPSPVAPTLSVVPRTDICPSYISDCADNMQANIPAPVTPPDVGVASALDTVPEATFAVVQAPAEMSFIPAADKLTVAAGDNLTHIIERQYGIAEGSANFDKVMTEVAKANGLVGNQQNWLKVGWELSMPSIGDPAHISAELNRVALDANWRAGDVVFSHVPKLAPAQP